MLRAAATLFYHATHPRLRHGPFAKKVTSKANQLVQLHWIGREGESKKAAVKISPSFLPRSQRRRSLSLMLTSARFGDQPSFFCESLKNQRYSNMCAKGIIWIGVHTKLFFAYHLRVDREHFLQGVCPSFRPYSTLHNVAQQCGLSRFSRG